MQLYRENRSYESAPLEKLHPIWEVKNLSFYVWLAFIMCGGTYINKFLLIKRSV